MEGSDVGSLYMLLYQVRLTALIDLTQFPDIISRLSSSIYQGSISWDLYFVLTSARPYERLALFRKPYIDFK